MNQTKQKTNTVSFRAKTGLLARISGIEARADKHWFVLLWMAAAFLGVTFGEAKSGFAAQVKYNDLSSINADTPSEHFGSVVDVEATVTFVNDMREFIFVQDGDDGIFVYRPEMGNVTIGQRVRVVGELAKGDLMPIVISPKVSVIGEGDLPKSPKISEITLDHDCLYLSLEFDVLQVRVGGAATQLYAETDSGENIYVEIQHSDGILQPSVANLAGSRVECTGVLGLQMAGGFFQEPGLPVNRIVGYKLLCSSFDNVKTVKTEGAKLNSEPAQLMALSFLEAGKFPDGRFLTFAQICQVDYVGNLGFVVCDGSTFVRFALKSSDNLKTGMLMRIGGVKTTDDSGQPKFEVDYLRYVGETELPRFDLSSMAAVKENFSLYTRVSIEGKPLRILEDHDNSNLILADGASTILVHFQDAALDTLPSFGPSVANRIRVTGVVEHDEEYDFKLTVVRANDVHLIERKTSLTRMFTIGSGGLLAICGLAAFWIRLLRNQVAQKQRFESIFDNAGCPILVFNGNLQIVDANQLAADLTGYSKEDLRDMSFTQIDKLQSEDEIKAMIVPTMENQEVGVFPTKVENFDEQIVDVEVHCRNLSKSDDPDQATYIAIFPDVSARTKYENELKEARDEAIKANTAKSQFVASMSHELRTPLNGVIGMTQLLESTDLTPTQADYLAACRTSGETLLTVIGDVLDFSKMEAGKLELAPRETKLIPFVENVVRATSLQQKARHVDLASFVDPRLSRSVMVDSDRLRQVIFNLVGNAAKFTSRGSVTVTAKCNEVTDDYADVQFIVSDTGIGIPQSRIDHLFEAFEQLDSSTTREFGGTGLGLTICKQIVDLMDGRIHVQSIEGLGSKFMIDVRLPFAKQTVDQDIHQIEVTEQRVATVGMSDPISKLLRDMFESYQVDAEFFNESDVIPDGKFDVVLLNSKGDSQAVSRFIAMQPSLSQSDAPILIPVVPADCVIKPEEWENLGVEKPIFKPFTQTRFLQPVYSSQERGELAKADTFQSSCGTQRTLRVMICEDNMVNQMFAKEICRKAGIEVVVCDNGKIAVDELALDSNFDAIFMDCHMPVMDGFEATRKIHELVEADIIAKIPVIALTANALADDRDKCLDVGMDDYLTKPFEIGDFLEKIHTNALLRTEVEPSQTCDTHCHESIFDIDKLESQFNDRQFALDIAEQFVETLPEFKADLEDCRDQNDAEKAFKLGHRLKGTAGTVQATRIKNSATELESAARNGQIEDLENQISKVLSELESFATVVKKEKASWAVKV